MPSLKSVLTTNVWKDRVMGLSKTSPSPCARCGGSPQTTWSSAATCLGAHCTSALRANAKTRRSVSISSTLTCSRGSEPTDVGSSRARFTLLRAFTSAGSPLPAGMSLWGSFEEWTRLIPAALVWAGMPDPMRVRASAQAGISQDRGNLLAILNGIRHLRGTHPATGKELIAELFSEPGLKTPRSTTCARPSRPSPARR